MGGGTELHCNSKGFSVYRSDMLGSLFKGLQLCVADCCHRVILTTSCRDLEEAA